uniref:ParB-like N-terminal domain-containing protein n=1 Tax=Oscillatoriales cyanobacterium SpSt-402 TaxID=2282168 RepID=A0A832H1Z8_9CYAN
MAKQRIGLGTTFAGAVHSQKITELEERNESLEAEIARLKASGGDAVEKNRLEAKVQELVKQLETKHGAESVPISQIIRNPFQPRTIFPLEEIKAFANILDEEGQSTPVILIPLSDEDKENLWVITKDTLFEELSTDKDRQAAWEEVRYFLFDGERRWRSSKLLGWNTLKAVFRPKEDLDLMRIQGEALSTTLHRKDLHELNLATCLIQQILYHYPHLQVTANGQTPEKAIPKILESAINRLNYIGKASELRKIVTASVEEQMEWLSQVDLRTEEERQVLEVILKYQLHPGSIDSNVFPTLELPHDLKQLVQETGLEISKVNELKKLSAGRLNIREEDARSLRARLGQKMAVQGLKLSEVKSLVEQEMVSHGIVSGRKRKTTAEQIREIKLEKLKASDLQDVITALKDKLEDAEAALRKVEKR